MKQKKTDKRPSLLRSRYGTRSRASYSFHSLGEFWRYMTLELPYCFGNILPACLLALILSLAIPARNQINAKFPATVPGDFDLNLNSDADFNQDANQDANLAFNQELNQDLDADFNQDFNKDLDPDLIKPAPVPNRVRLLSTAGERWERIRTAREGDKTESLIRAILKHDRIFQLSSTAMRMEQSQVRTRRNSPAHVDSTAGSVQFALHDDIIYAFTEEEETEENRRIVIDNAVSGGNTPFNSRENAERVYIFAKEVLGVNTAAACGILANIQHESGFNPCAVFIEADGRISYGICQWNAGRLLALQDYCEQHGYDASSLGGQLQYLQYELTTRERAAFYRVRGVSNTASGAYEAGYNWARYFERCADRYYTGRAETAYLTYWTKYGEADESFVLSIIGETFPPSSMETGSVIDLRGVIRSDAKIIRVSAFIQDASGNIIQSHEQSWNSGRYNLETDGVNQALRFSQLSPGDYIYIIRAADLSGAEKTLIESKFMVGGADNERIPLYAEIPDSEKSQNPQDPENPENPQDSQDSQNPDSAAAVSGTENAPESGASDVKSGENPGENPDANLLSVPDGTGDINANSGANSGANGGNPDANRNGDSVPAMNGDGDAGLNNSDPDEQIGTPIPESPATDFNPISDEEWALISQEGYWEPVTPQEQNQEQNQDNQDNQDEIQNGNENQSENQTENQNGNQNDGQSGDMNDGKTAPEQSDNAPEHIDTNTPDNNAPDDLNPSENQTDTPFESVYTEPASPIEPGANSSTQVPESPILPEEAETTENQPDEVKTANPAQDEAENITPDEVETANPATEETEITSPTDENAAIAETTEITEATETGEAVESEDINPADSSAPENNPVEPEENAVLTDSDAESGENSPE